jgi:hypothetical protein
VTPERGNRVGTDVVIVSGQRGRASVLTLKEHHVAVSPSCNVIDEIGNRPSIAPTGLVEITGTHNRKSIYPQLLSLIQRFIDLYDRHA